MVKKNNMIAFIPVRGGSKSIPLKNIKMMAGKPLVYWTIDAAANSKHIDKVYISTDSDIIKEVVDKYDGNNKHKIIVVERSSKNASDTASTESAMIEFAERNDFDNIILIQATSPLLKSEDLDLAIEKYPKYNSIISLTAQKRFIWEKDKENTVNPVNYDFMNRPRRQEFEGFLVENGAFYITSRERLLKYKCRISGKIGYHLMGEESYYEIDELSDWDIVEKLLHNNVQ